MHPRETGRRYDAIASSWDQQRRESAQGVGFLERAIALCRWRGRALDIGCGSGGPVIEKLCGYLAEHGVLLFTAGGVDGEIVGNMHGHEFAYSSLSETAFMELVQLGGCVPVLVERDQYPLHHLVVMAAKNLEASASTRG